MRDRVFEERGIQTAPKWRSIKRLCYPPFASMAQNVRKSHMQVLEKYHQIHSCGLDNMSFKWTKRAFHSKSCTADKASALRTSMQTLKSARLFLMVKDWEERWTCFLWGFQAPIRKIREQTPPSPVRHASALVHPISASSVTKGPTSKKVGESYLNYEGYQIIDF